MTTQQLLEKAKAAKLSAMLLDTETKNTALLKMADKLVEHTDKILAANKIDVENARGIISDVMIDRLSLSPERIEGMAKGIEEELATMLGNWSKLPMTYAGGVGGFPDLEKLRLLGKDKLDVTVGSALDIFGGNMIFEDVISYCNT